MRSGVEASDDAATPSRALLKPDTSANEDLWAHEAFCSAAGAGWHWSAGWGISRSSSSDSGSWVSLETSAGSTLSMVSSTSGQYQPAVCPLGDTLASASSEKLNIEGHPERSSWTPDAKKMRSIPSARFGGQGVDGKAFQVEPDVVAIQVQVEPDLVAIYKLREKLGKLIVKSPAPAGLNSSLPPGSNDAPKQEVDVQELLALRRKIADRLQPLASPPPAAREAPAGDVRQEPPRYALSDGVRPRGSFLTAPYRSDQQAEPASERAQGVLAVVRHGFAYLVTP